MNLNEFDKNNVAKKALKESFGYNFNPSNLDNAQTRKMLQKVRGLINESKRSPNFYSNQHSPTHLKLVFMEQVLSNQLKNTPNPRIVFENEEVEKSQVILAAQDMVDSVQKMIEEVSDMLVKELPALSDSIESEIGVNESEQFNSQVAEALGTLNASLQQAQTALKGALGIVTGKGGPSFDSQMAGGDAGADLEADNDMTDVDAQAGADMSLPPPPEPKEPMNNIGREKR